MLLQSQKLSIIEYAKQKGLHPNRLVFGEYKKAITGSGEVIGLRIDIKDSPYYFDFYKYYDVSRKKHYICTFSPGNTHMKSNANSILIVEILKKIENWLDYAAREIEAENKLNEILSLSESFFINDGNETNNKKFTEVERKEIDNRFKELEVRISQLQLQPEELKKITATLEEVKEKTKALGKIDWKNLFAGAILNTIVTLALNNNVANEIMTIISTMIFAGQGIFPLVK